MKQTIWHLLKKDDGSNVVELALLVPVLLLILAGAVDFGRAYFVVIEVNSAAHAGALYGSQNPMDTSGMIAAAKSNAPDISIGVPQATVGCECYDGTHNITSLATCSTEPDPCGIAGSANIGNLVYWAQVTTSATYRPILGFSGIPAWNIPGIPTSFALKGQSTMRAAY